MTVTGGNGLEPGVGVKAGNGRIVWDWRRVVKRSTPRLGGDLRTTTQIEQKVAEKTPIPERKRTHLPNKRGQAEICWNSLNGGGKGNTKKTFDHFQGKKKKTYNKEQDSRRRCGATGASAYRSPQKLGNAESGTRTSQKGVPWPRARKSVLVPEPVENGPAGDVRPGGLSGGRSWEKKTGRRPKRRKETMPKTSHNERSIRKSTRKVFTYDAQKEHRAGGAHSGGGKGIIQEHGSESKLREKRNEAPNSF